MPAAVGGSAGTAAATPPAAGGGMQDSGELSAQARLLLGLIQAMNGGQAQPSAPQVYGPPGIRLTAPGSGTLSGAGTDAVYLGNAELSTLVYRPVSFVFDNRAEGREVTGTRSLPGLN